MVSIEYNATLIGHEEDRVWHLSWSHDGMYLASCGEDKVIRIWSNINDPGCWNDAKNIVCISTLEEAQSRTIRSCEWSPDSRLIASASFDGIVIVWEAQNHSKINWDQVASLEGHDNEVKSVSWNYDGTLIATCGRDKKIWIWEKLEAGEYECISVLEGHTQDIKYIKFHHRMNVLFSCCYDDTIKVWLEDSDDWYCSQTLIGHGSTVWGLAIDYDTAKIVTCSDDLNIIMWENDNVNFTSEFRIIEKASNLHNFPIYSIDWNHDNKYIISAGGDNAIVLLNNELNEMYRIESAHESDVNCVRWNPHSSKSQYLASCGDDGVVKIWMLKIQ